MGAAVRQAEKNDDIPNLNECQSIQMPKGCDAKNEDVATAMNKQIFNFTSIVDVIKYKYNEELLKLALTSKGKMDSQTRIYWKCDSDDFGQVLGSATDVVYCEGKTIDAPYSCDLARFHTLTVYSDNGDYSNVANVKSQLSRIDVPSAS